MKLILVFLITIFTLLGSNELSHCKTYKDAVGRDVVIEGSPVRIVPLVPSLTEILYYLDLGDRVVGVTNFSYYPPEATKKPKIGTYIKLDIEKIIMLEPDLVIGTKDGNNPRIIDLLEQVNIPTYIVNPKNVEQIIETLQEIGRICGVSKRAEMLALGLENRIQRIRANVEKKKKPLVFLQISLHPIMSVNRNTFHHDVIAIAGGKNMMGNAPVNYPRIGVEKVIMKNPDVIIISSMDRNGMFDQAKQEWFKWRSISAVKNKRVYLIDSDLLDRPSPRIVDGIEAMARIIHPEVDWDGLNNGAGLKAQGAGKH